MVGNPSVMEVVVVAAVSIMVEMLVHLCGGRCFGKNYK